MVFFWCIELQVGLGLTGLSLRHKHSWTCHNTSMAVASPPVNHRCSKLWLALMIKIDKCAARHAIRWSNQASFPQHSLSSSQLTYILPVQISLMEWKKEYQKPGKKFSPNPSLDSFFGMLRWTTKWLANFSKENSLKFKSSDSNVLKIVVPAHSLMYDSIFALGQIFPILQCNSWLHNLHCIGKN